MAKAAELKQQKKKAAKAKRDAEKKEADRQKRMKQMVADPDRFIRETTKLVEQRGTDNYKAAADLLYDLREAIGGESGNTLARHHAAHLTKKHPTLTHLKSSLRKRNLF